MLMFLLSDATAGKINAMTLEEILKSYVTPEVAAKRLKIGIRAVQTACDLGQLPGAVKVGNAWHIPKAALEDRINLYGKGPIPQASRPNPLRK